MIGKDDRRSGYRVPAFPGAWVHFGKRGAGQLHELLLQSLYRVGGRRLLVKYPIDGVSYRHVYVELFVYLVDTCRRVVALRYHRHLYHGAFYGVSLAYHRSECPVTAEIRIAGHQQVTQINRFIYVSVQRMYRIQETVHLLDSVGNQYGLKVVAVFQSAANTGGDSIYVFEYRTVLDT